MAQSDWWWCHKCQGLFFAGNPGSVCPAGQTHEKSAGAQPYIMMFQGGASGVTPGVDTSQVGVWADAPTGAGLVATGKIMALWVEASFGGTVAAIVKGHGPGATGLQVTVDSDPNALGVTASAGAGTGVRGVSATGRGVWGVSDSSMATVGDANTGTGVWGHSKTGPGVHAESDHSRGIEARGNPAGHFDGNVEVTGTVTAQDVLLSNADCAEDFDVEGADPEPGTVMVLSQEGSLRPASRAYDTAVAGVISGGGDYRPAIVLDKVSGPKRAPLALVGKVFCKVDAGWNAISAGDLLTTSPTPGHAMKAADLSRGFGAIIGKALRPLPSGRGLVPILIALH